MAADVLDLEPRYPLGDAGDLLEYRLCAGELTPITPKRSFGPLGHAYLAITCDWTPTTHPYVCGHLSGTAMDVNTMWPPHGVPIRYIDEPEPILSHAQWVLVAVTAVIVLAWFVFTLLFAFGVIDTINNQEIRQ